MGILKYGTTRTDFFDEVGTPDNITVAAELSPHVREGFGATVGSITSTHASFRCADAPVNPLFLTYYQHAFASFSNDGVILQLFDTTVSTTIPVIQIRRDTAATRHYNMTAYNGSTQVEVVALSNFGTNEATTYRWDVEVNIADTGGYVRVYVDGSLLMQWTGDTKTWTANGIDVARFLAPSGGASQRRMTTSGVMSADTPLLGAILVQHDAPAAGSLNTAASGTIADVDELGVDGSDFVRFDTSGQEMRFTSNLPTAYETGYEVLAHIVSAYAGTWGGEPPPNLSLGPRIGGVNYLSAVTPSVFPFQVYAQTPRIMALNPATGLPWTAAEVDGIENVMRVSVP